MITHQTTREKTKCPNCERTFFDLWNLKQHFSNSHPASSFNLSPEEIVWEDEDKEIDEEKPLCVVCRKNFQRAENLRRHMQSHHTMPRRKRSLKKHNNKHATFDTPSIHATITTVPLPLKKRQYVPRTENISGNQHRESLAANPGMNATASPAGRTLRMRDRSRRATQKAAHSPNMSPNDDWIEHEVS